MQSNAANPLPPSATYHNAITRLATLLEGVGLAFDIQKVSKISKIKF